MSVQVYETVNHEVNRLVIFLLIFFTPQCELVDPVLVPCVFRLNWHFLFLLTGPLRVLGVLLLVGLTWLLANTLFGKESGSSVRHFFIGKSSSSEAMN